MKNKSVNRLIEMKTFTKMVHLRTIIYSHLHNFCQWTKHCKRICTEMDQQLNHYCNNHCWRTDYFHTHSSKLPGERKCNCNLMIKFRSRTSKSYDYFVGVNEESRRYMLWWPLISILSGEKQYTVCKTRTINLCFRTHQAIIRNN